MTASSLTAALLLAGNEGCLSVVHNEMTPTSRKEVSMFSHPFVTMYNFDLSKNSNQSRSEHYTMGDRMPAIY